MRPPLPLGLGRWSSHFRGGHLGLTPLVPLLAASVVAAGLGGAHILQDPTGQTSDVLTQHNSNARTGVTVQPGWNRSIFARWGRQGVLTVNGAVYAQPLYASQLLMGDGKRHNVAFIATATNWIYAFDIDTRQPLWSECLAPHDNWEEAMYPGVDLAGSPVRLERTDEQPKIDPQNRAIHTNRVWEIGIQSTPVIDRAANTMYVSCRSRDAAGNPHQLLRALDIRTGAVLLRGECQARPPFGVPAPGFDLRYERQRASLLLLNGVIYVAFSARLLSCEICSDQPSHGWVLAMEARTLRQVGAFNVTPQGNGGGVWQASNGLAGDTDGSLYFITGNGEFSSDGRNLGNSFVRLRPQMTFRGNGSIAQVELKVADYFTPFNQHELNQIDLDLGAAGPLLLPGTRYLLGGGKEGWLYLINRDQMGKFDAQRDHVLQEFRAGENIWAQSDRENAQAAGNTGLQAGIDAVVSGNRRPSQQCNWLAWPHIHGSPVYHPFNNGRAMLYVWPEKDYLRAYQLVGSQFSLRATTQPQGIQAPQQGMPGGMLSLAVDPTQAGSGVLFASVPVTNYEATYMRGRLYAFDAMTLEKLWDNGAEPDYVIGKFCPPTVAGDRVLLPTFSNQVIIYGRT